MADDSEATSHSIRAVTIEYATPQPAGRADRLARRMKQWSLVFLLLWLGTPVTIAVAPVNIQDVCIFIWMGCGIGCLITGVLAMRGSRRSSGPGPAIPFLATVVGLLHVLILAMIFLSPS